MSSVRRHGCRRMTSWLSLPMILVIFGLYARPLLESDKGGQTRPDELIVEPEPVGSLEPLEPAEAKEDHFQEVPKRCWVFTHLQKCGGETIKEIIFKRWRRRHVIYDSPEWKRGNDGAQQFGQRLTVESRWDVISGGYPEALRESVGNACSWFTMFRDPISRLVSAYFYCKAVSVDWLCASDIVRARDVDLLGFARHWGNFGMRQFALKFVSPDEVVEFVKGGGVPWKGGDPLSLPGWYLLKMYLEHKAEMSGTNEAALLQEMMHPVRDLVHHNFSAVGILEEFDTTLELYNKALVMPGVDWVGEFNTTGKKNVNKKHTKKDTFLEQARMNTDIKDYISLDILLYEHAVNVFREQVDRHGL